LPEFVLHPPLESPNAEPCLVWIQEEINGLPNVENSSKTSCINSLLQLFANLRGIQENLPLLDQDALVIAFTRSIYSLHLGKMPMITTDLPQRLTSSPVPSNHREAVESLLTKFSNLIVSNPSDFCYLEPIYSVMINDILMKTRYISWGLYLPLTADNRHLQPRKKLLTILDLEKKCT
jgi:hypothetical protein